MTWEVEYTNEFEAWWNNLVEPLQEDVYVAVRLLDAFGPALDHPHSSGIKESRHSHMRELRVQSGGKPIRVLYAFDPRRIAILLIGGDKTGNDRSYKEYVPKADKLYERHLKEVEEEK